MGSSSRFASVVGVLCWCTFVGIAVSGKRPKRELRLPKGGSFVAAVALASVLPKGPTDGLIHFLEFDLGFPFPEKLQIGKAHADKLWKDRRGGSSEIGSKAKSKRRRKSRGQRHLKEDQKQKLLLQIEDAVTRGGLGGSACLSRFQCELRHISPRSSLLEELLSALFTPAHGDDKCHQVDHHCPISLLHALMHSEQTAPYYGALGPHSTEAPPALRDTDHQRTGHVGDSA